MGGLPVWTQWGALLFTVAAGMYAFFIKPKDATIENLRAQIDGLKSQISDRDRVILQLREASPDKVFDILKKKHDYIVEQYETLLLVKSESERSEIARLEAQRNNQDTVSNQFSGVDSLQRLIDDNNRGLMWVSQLSAELKDLSVTKNEEGWQDGVKGMERNRLIDSIVNYIGVERIRQANDASFIRAWNAMIAEWRHHPMHPPVPINGGGIDRLKEVGMVEGTEVTPLGILVIRAAARKTEGV